MAALVTSGSVQLRACSLAPPRRLHVQRRPAHAVKSHRLPAMLRAETGDQTATEQQRAKQARAAVTRRIKQLGEQGKVRDAIQELAGLAKVGVQPDTQAATALVAACVAAGNMEVAQTIFEELFGGFLKPDEVTFACLLRGYGAAKPEPSWSQIDSTLTRMRQSYGIEPSAVSYNALLEVCVASNDMDRGMDIIDRMDADGVVPDDLTEQVVSTKRSLRSYLKKRLREEDY